jgi:hypothetical protein
MKSVVAFIIILLSLVVYVKTYENERFMGFTADNHCDKNEVGCIPCPYCKRSYPEKEMDIHLQRHGIFRI